MTAPRVLVVGADSLDPTLVRGWAAAGRLPTLAALLDRGMSAAIENPIGLFVGGLWPSFFTGRSPARHGRYCHHQITPGAYEARPVPAARVRGEPFWEALGRAGRRVAVVDVPKTQLARGLNGIHLVDWGTHDPDPGATFQTWPTGLADEVRARFGDDPVGSCDRAPHDADGLAALRDRLLTRVRTKTRLFVDLLQREPWDLFLGVYNDPQCVGHQFWHLHDPTHPRHDPALAQTLGDPILDVYRAIDDGLGELLGSVGPETLVLVVASHGMGPNYAGSFLLDEILMRLETAALPAGTARRGLGDLLHWCWQRTPLRLGMLPAPVRDLLRGRIGRAMPQLDVVGTRRAFALPNNDSWGAVRLNLVGREPFGRVEPGAEADALLARLTADLEALVDVATGRPVVGRVVRTGDVYPRRPDDDLPDLLVEWRQEVPFGSVHSPRAGTIPGEHRGRRTGDHREEGLLVVVGPAVGTGPLARAVSIMDLAPTIGASLGVPLADVDGRIISDIAVTPAGSPPLADCAPGGPR